ncbi:MAG: AMP-binding protein, partial [Rhodobacteraceae bacterium]|nr:AMP-binding protein [Paracoccaceae bacterium]
MVFNPWMCHHLMFRDDDVMLCPLPLFHVFAAYPLSTAAIAAGAHIVLLTPQGFRGDGVFDNFWKVIERWRSTFLVVVPAALSALEQRPINADVSSLRYMISGSAPLSEALFKKFEADTGVKILEGYGMTEATCVTSCNPPSGERRIGSVGIPLPYIYAKVCRFDDTGVLTYECETEEIGEICFSGPCIFPGYREAEKNIGVFHDDAEGVRWLRTGDLGRIDADGYIWITGRAKDLIIRGGHNIDPRMIEEALAEHPAVALSAAVGQPDAYAGELPCAFVQLRKDMTADPEELIGFAARHIGERAARPAHVAVIDEMPVVGPQKIFKPALRKLAIERVYGAALEKAGVSAKIAIVDDEKLGMVAEITPSQAGVDEAALEAALDGFIRPWRLASA